MRGVGKLTVAFAPPAANGGSAITGFSSTCTSSGGGVTATRTGAASPIAVTSLTNGKRYTCTIRAINAAGSGAHSAASAALRPGQAPYSDIAPTVKGAAV